MLRAWAEVTRSTTEHPPRLEGADQLLQDCREGRTIGETECSHSQYTEKPHDVVRNVAELFRTEQGNPLRWIRQTTAVACATSLPVENTQPFAGAGSPELPIK